MRQSMRRHLVSPLPLRLAVLIFAILPWQLACGGAQHPAASDAASAVDTRAIPELADGMLTVIVFPVVDEPFLAPNLKAGTLPVRAGRDHYQGIDADVMTAFAKHLGVDLEFLRLEEPGFGALIPALARGEGDLVASAMSITEERHRIVDFSRPYFTIATVVITRRGASIHQLADLTGKLGVGVRGSRPLSMIHELGVECTLVEVDFQTGAYAELTDGNADFALLESASARGALAERPGLEIAFELPGHESYGYAVAKGSALKAVLDPFLDQLEESGELDRIIKHHLGAAASDT